MSQSEKREKLMEKRGRKKELVGSFSTKILAQK